jgi:hypothetical protein
VWFGRREDEDEKDEKGGREGYFGMMISCQLRMPQDGFNDSCKGGITLVEKHILRHLMAQFRFNRF